MSLVPKGTVNYILTEHEHVLEHFCASKKLSQVPLVWATFRKERLIYPFGIYYIHIAQ